MSPAEQKQMVKKYQCLGCMRGSDTNCGTYKPNDLNGGSCLSHVLGTSEIGIGLFALGFPKGFNRPGVTWDDSGRLQSQHKMEVRFSDVSEPTVFDKFNVAVWAIEYEGDLLVRTYAPRVNRTVLDVVRGGTLSLVPQAINVCDFVGEID